MTVFATVSAGDVPGSSIGIHGNVNANSIGKHVSHGCIRMYNEEIPIVFNMVPIGTEVWIGTSQELADWGIEM